MQRKQTQIPDVFLFINSGSGDGVGKELLQKQEKQLNFEVPRSQHPGNKQNLVKVTIHMYNLKDEQSRHEGFALLRQQTLKEKRVILVVCGGDGTVMWVVTEMSNFKIDHSKVPIAIIPLGTGNDFSRTMGWGHQSSDLLDNDYAKLKKRITYWLSAQQQSFDIWMTEAECHDYGKFQKIQNSQNTIIEGKKITKHFCNYFSIGVDGKVGYAFDKRRTSSRIGNLAMYGVMGFIKSFTKTKTLGELTHELRQSKVEPINPKEIKIYVNEQTRESRKSDKVILQKDSQKMQIYKDNENILFININSFMGGVKDVWASAKTPKSIQQTPFSQQNHSDGKLQVLSFSGVWSMGFQKTVGGCATKVYQGNGPFQFQFNQYPEQQKHRTYLQIDGQFIRYTHPKKIVIKQSNLSKNGQIRVLKRVPMQIQKGCCGCV